MSSPSPDDLSQETLWALSDLRVRLEGYIRAHPDKIAPKFLYVLTEHPKDLLKFAERSKGIALAEQLTFNVTDQEHLQKTAARDFIKEFDNPGKKLRRREILQKTVFGGTLIIAAGALGLIALSAYETVKMKEYMDKRQRTLDEIEQEQNPNRKELLQKQLRETDKLREEYIASSGANAERGIGMIILGMIGAGISYKMGQKTSDLREAVDRHRTATERGFDPKHAKMLASLEGPLQRELKRMRIGPALEGHER